MPENSSAPRREAADPRERRTGRRLIAGEPLTYAAFAALCVLVTSHWFVESLQWQLFLSSARSGSAQLTGHWSAPLDDVFIHFDFARSAASGAPFEWAPGNGYSSGGTSLLYPLVLSVGYALGFGDQVMLWALIVACVSVLATLLAARRLFGGLGPAYSYVLPLLLLSVGGLNWSLYSGMEVAWFLATWGLSLVLWDDASAPVARGEEALGPSLLLGLGSSVMVASRPEAVTAVVVFSLASAAEHVHRAGWRRGAIALLSSALPPALMVVGQAVANRAFTGAFAAAGALAKLELYDPLIDAHTIGERWAYHVQYQVTRITEYHLGTIPFAGWLVWGFAAIALIPRTTRRYAALLWAQALGWILLVALNGQVIWQNERYTMPAVAWLLMAAALGLSASLATSLSAYERLRPALERQTGCLSRQINKLEHRALGLVVPTLLLGLLGCYFYFQLPRHRDQVWFFGRASRNIYDQHIRAARIINRLQPRPQRVLVGDAGAIPFETGLPAFDLIGLGGYHDLPVARAQRWGVAATAELLQRLPRSERPDLFALYPTWWGSFPHWFGTPLVGIPVRGNVICGGAVKMLYQADWSAFDRSETPETALSTEIVVDRLDVADLLSEREHHFELNRGLGPVTMALERSASAASPPGSLIWDAGRRLLAGDGFSFRVGAAPVALVRRLVVRLTAPGDGAWTVSAGGTLLGRFDLTTQGGWQEHSVSLSSAVEASQTLQLQVVAGEIAFHHLWLVQER